MGDVGDRLAGALKRGKNGTLSDGRVTYQNLFHLGGERIPLSEMSVKNYTQAVSNNFKPLGTALKNTATRQAGGLMEGVSARSYLRDTVYKGNVNDITNLFKSDTASTGKQIGTGLAKAGGIGLMAFDVFKGAKNTYDAYSAQEDGSAGSKMQTYLETGKTVVKKTLKNAVAWEAAGMGFAVGSALLPVAGPVGMLAGMDKILPDSHLPESEPEADSSNEAISEPAAASSPLLESSSPETTEQPVALNILG